MRFLFGMVAGLAAVVAVLTLGLRIAGTDHDRSGGKAPEQNATAARVSDAVERPSASAPVSPPDAQDAVVENDPAQAATGPVEPEVSENGSDVASNRSDVSENSPDIALNATVPDDLPPETEEDDVPSEIEQTANTAAVLTDLGEAAAVLSEPAPGDTPSIDVLRIERDGTAILSGNAPPNAEVEVLLDEQPIERTRVDGGGSFAMILSLPPASAPQVLSIRSRDNLAEARGTQTFIVEPAPLDQPELARAPEGIRPPAPPEDRAPVLPDATGTEDVGAVQDVAGLENDTATAVEAGDADMPRMARNPVAPQPASPGTSTAPDAPVRPVALDADEGGPPNAFGADGSSSNDQPGITAPQGPADPARAQTQEEPGPAPERPASPAAPRVLAVAGRSLEIVQDDIATPTLSIDTISYQSEGNVVLGGRAPGNAAVRVYLDGRPLDASRTEDDGQWRVNLPVLEERAYTLRVDQLAEDGTVTARAETPFKPESQADLDRLAGEISDGIRRVTVQPGFTLWAIAERNYGDGLGFVRVFEANAEKIRDPDLIYPGQIFTVPD